jgi:hypothetical protein
VQRDAAEEDTTMWFWAARADMAAAIEGADAGALEWSWDRIQAALATTPVLTRCLPEQAVERERLLGERDALLAARPVLINR